MVSVDPVQSELNRQSGLLARRIVRPLIPGDTVAQEIAIEILTRTFQYISRGSWNRVRTDVIQTVRNQLLPRIGEERTQRFMEGAQIQVNRVAREHGVDIPEDNVNWLIQDTGESGVVTIPMNHNGQTHHIRVPASQARPLLENTARNNVRAILHEERANEYGARQDMDYEDEQSTVQRERQWARENFQFQSKSFYNLPWRPQLILINDNEQMRVKNKLW